MRALRTLASMKLTVACLLALALLVVWGTLYQVGHGIYDAQRHFFGAWFVPAFGFLPVPSVKALVLVLSANLLAAIPVRIGFGWRRVGLQLIHAGIVVLLAGGAVAHYAAREAVLTVREGDEAGVAVVRCR
jgi:cytochrome c biogenesis factor